MELLTTPLDSLHRELGAKMVPFAGYSMPVQYRDGIIKEHLQTRSACGLFDVSHMGQFIVQGPNAATTLEALMPADLLGLAVGQQTYTLLTNEAGGVMDDLIVTRWAQDQFFLVVNAACKADDIAYIRAHLTDEKLTVLSERALLALQGPKARAVLSRFVPDIADLTFMHGKSVEFLGQTCFVSASGYTGEDGFELSLAAGDAQQLAQQLLSCEEVSPVGLGARDSLRLEAGLCLYGHELSADIDPVQAGLIWAVAKARRVDGARPGGFPGADHIFDRMSHGAERQRIGLRVKGKRPVRDGQVLIDAQGGQVGEICSAAYGASAGGPIAMAYVDKAVSQPGTELFAQVRDKLLPVEVCKMPWVPTRYFRG